MRGPAARTIGAALGVAVVAAPATTHATSANDRRMAGTVYDRGVAAQARGDFREAARAFAEADAIVPSDVALGAALDAAARADDAALAMRLVERADARPSGRLTATAGALRARFAKRAGKVRLVCARCTASVDREPLRAGEARWLTAGRHAVRFDLGGHVEERSFDLDPLVTIDLSPSDTHDEPVRERPAREAPREGLAPIWFWVPAGLAAVAGASAVASLVDTQNLHDAFLGAPTDDLAARGRAAETRTWVLTGLAGAFATTAVVLGVTRVRWLERAPVVAVGPRGVALEGRF